MGSLGRGRVAALTAFWKHRDTDPVLFSIFHNDADEEAHGGLIKLDRAADFVSRVNPGLEMGPRHRKKKKIQFGKMQIVHSGRKKPLEQYSGISKQDVGHVEETRGGEATAPALFPQGGRCASVLMCPEG